MYYKLYSNVIFFLLCMIYYASAQQTKPQIILSSRWFHPTSKADSVSTLDVIKKLNPDRIDWTYTDKEEYLDKYRNLGIPFSLALNPQLPDSAEYTTSKTRIVTIDGENYVAPWMKKWNQKNPYWGCVNNPQFVTAFETKLAQYSKVKGLDAFFIDDEYFNFQLQAYSYEKKVGCVCSYCLNKFYDIYKTKTNKAEFNKKVLTSIQSAYLNTNSLSSDVKLIVAKYKKFQELSVVQFWKNCRAKFPNKKFKMNNYGCNWNAIRNCFDVGIGELEEKDLNYNTISKIYSEATKLGKQQIISLISKNLDLQVWLVAYCLIKNQSVLIPWDIYINGGKRFYCNLDSIATVFNSIPYARKNIKQNAYLKQIEFDDALVSLYENSNNQKVIIILDKNPYQVTTISYKNKLVLQLLKKQKVVLDTEVIYSSGSLYIVKTTNQKK